VKRSLTDVYFIYVYELPQKIFLLGGLHSLVATTVTVIGKE